MFPGAPASFELGSFSSGFHTIFIEWTVAEEAFLPDSLGTAWGFLFYSVTQSSMGVSGSLIADERMNSPGGAGGDMFSVVLPGSNLPDGIDNCVDLGVPQRTNDSSELGLSVAGSPELRDFDPFLPFYETEAFEPGPPTPAVGIANPWVYFTLPYAVATAPSSAWLFGGETASSATILRMQWDPAIGTNGMWGGPQIFADYLELGLLVDDEIDALCIDEVGTLGIGAHALLSLKKKAGSTPAENLEQQLMAARIGNHGSPGPAWAPATPYLTNAVTLSGTPPTKVSKQILGADDDDDIDAICSGDPNSLNAILTAWFPYIYGCRDVPGWDTTMSASAWVQPSDTNTTISVSVSGLQEPQGSPGLVGFLLWAEPSTAWDHMTIGGPYVPFNVVAGWSYAIATSQTARVDLVFPYSSGTWPVTHLDFQWLMLNASGIRQSNVVGCKF